MELLLDRSNVLSENKSLLQAKKLKNSDDPLVELIQQNKDLFDDLILMDGHVNESQVASTATNHTSTKMESWNVLYFFSECIIQAIKEKPVEKTYLQDVVQQLGWNINFGTEFAEVFELNFLCGITVLLGFLIFRLCVSTKKLIPQPQSGSLKKNILDRVVNALELFIFLQLLDFFFIYFHHLLTKQQKNNSERGLYQAFVGMVGKLIGAHFPEEFSQTINDWSGKKIIDGTVSVLHAALLQYVTSCSHVYLELRKQFYFPTLIGVVFFDNLYTPIYNNPNTQIYKWENRETVLFKIGPRKFFFRQLQIYC